MDSNIQTIEIYFALRKTLTRHIDRILKTANRARLYGIYKYEFLLYHKYFPLSVVSVLCHVSTVHVYWPWFDVRCIFLMEWACRALWWTLRAADILLGKDNVLFTLGCAAGYCIDCRWERNWGTDSYIHTGLCCRVLYWLQVRQELRHEENPLPLHYTCSRNQFTIMEWTLVHVVWICPHRFPQILCLLQSMWWDT